MRWGSIIFIE